MDVAPLRDHVDRELECVRLRWRADDDIDHTLVQKDRGSEVQVMRTDKWF